MIERKVNYFGKQNEAFSCHREEINSVINSVKPFHIVALLKLQAVNESILHEHLYSSMMHNATYLYPISQNKMMNVFEKKIIQKDTLSEIRKSKFHAVIVDEVTSDNKKILSWCMRFADTGKKYYKRIC